MQRIDDAAVHVAGIPRLLLMDAAGRATAEAVRSLVPSPTNILICCGLGYNGGDGLCAAWYLSRWGYPLILILAGDRARLKDESAIYAGILEQRGMRLELLTRDDQLDRADEAAAQAAAIVDALLGIGLTGPVRPLYAQLIERMNRARKPIVAVDIPSGLDADTGLPSPVAVRASLTVTFGAVKQGLLRGEGSAHTGRLVVDDIGIPRQFIEAAHP